MSKDKKEKKTRKKADIPVDEDGKSTETKEERFVRVCTPRVKRAIIQIRMVKQTISGNNYSMTDEQLGTIVSRLHEEVATLQNAFDGKNKSKQKEAIEVNL